MFVFLVSLSSLRLSLFQLLFCRLDWGRCASYAVPRSRTVLSGGTADAGIRSVTGINLPISRLILIPVGVKSCEV